jgi:hypothetical protein
MLGNLFGISPATVTKIFVTWILFLKSELEFLLPFSTLEEMEGIDQAEKGGIVPRRGNL